MSTRRVDIRTTRKARPAATFDSRPESCAAKNIRSCVRSNICGSPRDLRKLQRVKQISSKLSSPDLNTEEVSNIEESVKSRRRRLDASDYIRRRFLYDDDTEEKISKSKSGRSHKRAVSHDTKFRSSPLALMAASSANLQKKRRRFHDKNPPDNQAFRGRRGRKRKFLMSSMTNQDKSMETLSSLDGNLSADEHISDESGNRIVGSYADRSVIEHDENSHLLKPLFRKTQKKCTYKRNGDSPSEALQSHLDYVSELPGFFLDDEMNDFTRSRGPVVLSKRARHRLIPRSSPPKRDFIKPMTEYPDFGFGDSDEAYRHQIRANFLHPTVSINEASRVGNIEWSGHMEESIDPASVNSVKQSGMEIEDFAGDLLPQSTTAVNCPPASGSSRRKSPIRPMQVLRSEPIIYNAENGGPASVTSAGATLSNQQHLIPSFPQASGREAIGAVAANLVDLCAAAGLDSTSSNQTQLSNATDCTDSGEQSTPSLISTVPQYSLINSKLVSLQPSGRVFVDAGSRTPLPGYTVASTTPVSRISLVPGRYSYGHGHTLSRVSHSLTGSKTVSFSSGPTNSSTTNPGFRRRPTILKRGAVPTPSSSSSSVPKLSPGYNVPRLSPPFMRTALRSVQASSIAPVVQHSTRPMTYTIVSASPSGQPSVFAFSSAPSATDPPSSQTASSRLFGPKRNTGVSQTAEAGSAPSFPSSNLTLISCLPNPAVSSVYRNK